MSHVTTCELEVRDLDALESAVKEMGATLTRGVKEYAWYGTSVGDYPIPKGMTVETLGKCDHVIRVPGVGYEVGVVQTVPGKYTLAYDFYGPGRGLLAKFGERMNKLKQMYGVHVATRTAQKRGMNVQRVQTSGGIRLVMTGGGM